MGGSWIRALSMFLQQYASETRRHVPSVATINQKIKIETKHENEKWKVRMKKGNEIDTDAAAAGAVASAAAPGFATVFKVVSRDASAEAAAPAAATSLLISCLVFISNISDF